MSATKGSAGGGEPIDRFRRTSSPAERMRKKNIHEIRKRHIARDLEGLLSSLAIASDKELGSITREIDQVADGLPQDGSQKFSERVRPIVWSALKQAILERELRHLALTDDLTCLYNRRGFFAAATQQLKTARRNMQSMLLIVCDIDNLKEINDSFGHREGDFALVRMADTLEETFRESDVLARLGGDEFAVLAVGASNYHQDCIARRFKQAIDKSNSAESRYQISVSLGHARFDPHSAADLSELIITADRAMHNVKGAQVSTFRSFNVRNHGAKSEITWSGRRSDADEW
jgi:diguanylate cyclase (GGDEF)-like protein